jgi:RimJ/RimL family protein N-acetyltransferase
VNLWNERSRRALEALGTVREGVLRRNQRLPDGGFCDDVVYSLLHEEWPGVKARLLARLYGPEGRP